MMGINKQIVVGNVGNDVELRHTGSGTPVANIRVATPEKWKDKDGNPQERTEWHNVTLFGKLAEISESVLSKGSRIYAEGRTQTDEYQDKDGIERKAKKIVAHTMINLDPPKISRDSSPDSSPDSGPAVDEDDDIPF